MLIGFVGAVLSYPRGREEPLKVPWAAALFVWCKLTKDDVAKFLGGDVHGG